MASNIELPQISVEFPDQAEAAAIEEVDHDLDLFDNLVEFDQLLFDNYADKAITYLLSVEIIFNLVPIPIL